MFITFAMAEPSESNTMTMPLKSSLNDVDLHFGQTLSFVMKWQFAQAFSFISLALLRRRCFDFRRFLFRRFLGFLHTSHFLLNPFHLPKKRLPRCHSDFSRTSRPAERNSSYPDAHLISARQLPLRLFSEQDALLFIVGNVVIHQLRDMKQRVHRSNADKCTEVRYLHHISLHHFLNDRIEREKRKRHLMKSRAVTGNYLPDRAHLNTGNRYDVAQLLIHDTLVFRFHLFLAHFLQWVTEGFRRNADSILKRDKFKHILYHSVN